MKVVTGVDSDPQTEYIDHVIIWTLEGEMRGDLGDWVIVGIGGELYPCKHDIFINSYEEAHDR